jgi:site-specific recombinase XerD
MIRPANLRIVQKSDRIPIRPAVTDFLHATKRRRNVMSQKGYAQRLYCFADWADGLGVSLESVDRGVIDAFLDHLVQTHQPKKRGATQLSSATLAGFVCAIKTFLIWASKDRAIYSEFVSAHVVADIERPKIAFIIIETFTPEEVRALLVACDQEENERQIAKARAIMHLLLGTGIRARECCNLTMADITFQDDGPSFIKVVQGKGSKDRKIPLGPITRRKLAYYVETYRKDALPEEALFTNRNGRGKIGNATLEQLFERLAKRAGITNKRCSPHSMRHTFSYNSIKSGMSVYALSKLLGHSSVLMTERYCRALGADFDALAEMVAGQLR